VPLLRLHFAVAPRDSSNAFAVDFEKSNLLGIDARDARAYCLNTVLILARRLVHVHESRSYVGYNCWYIVTRVIGQHARSRFFAKCERAARGKFENSYVPDDINLSPCAICATL